MTRPAVAITIGRAHYRRMFSAEGAGRTSRLRPRIVHHPGDEPASKQDLMAVLADADACHHRLGEWPRLDADVVAAAPRLGHMAHMGGSVKRFVSGAVWNRGIRVTSAAVTLARDVAETTLGLDDRGPQTDLAPGKPRARRRLAGQLSLGPVGRPGAAPARRWASSARATSARHVIELARSLLGDHPGGRSLSRRRRRGVAGSGEGRARKS